MGNCSQRPKCKRRININKANLVDSEESIDVPQCLDVDLSCLRSFSTKVTDNDLINDLKDDSFIQENQADFPEPCIHQNKVDIDLIKNEFDNDANSNSSVSKSLLFLRESFFMKLYQAKIWRYPFINSSFNCIYIYDWDDTLMFTSEFYLKSPVISKTNNEVYKKLCSILKNKDTQGITNLLKEDLLNIKAPFTAQLNKIVEIKNKVYDILNRSADLGDVFIVTNASRIWVETCCFIFYPEIYSEVFKRIKIISAKEEFEGSYPVQEWKKEMFLSLAKYYNKALPTSITVVGDSEYEIESALHLHNMFKDNSEFYCKTVKFKEKPSYDLLIKQLELFSSNLDLLSKKQKSVNIVMAKMIK